MKNRNAKDKELDLPVLIGITEALLHGANPYTGEIFEDDHIINDENIQQILMIANKRILSRMGLNAQRPEAAGARWTKEEDEQLKQEYKSGMGIKEIAKLHSRSRGSINSRIVKILSPELLPD